MTSVISDSDMPALDSRNQGEYYLILYNVDPTSDFTFFISFIKLGFHLDQTSDLSQVRPNGTKYTNQRRSNSDIMGPNRFTNSRLTQDQRNLFLPKTEVQ